MSGIRDSHILFWVITIGLCGFFLHAVASHLHEPDIVHSQEQTVPAVEIAENQPKDDPNIKTSYQVSSIYDINGDGAVDLQDVLLLRQHYGKTDSTPADLNKDGIVNLYDYNILMSEFLVYDVQK